MINGGLKRQIPDGGPEEAAGRGLGSDFARLWSASSISTLGDGLYLTALLLIGASFTRNPALLSGIAAASTLPWVIFGLFSGAIVDRADPRRIMWLTDAVRAVVVGLLTVILVTGHGSIWVLIVVSFLLATGETLYVTAVQAIVPVIVSRAPEKLQRANSRLVSAQTGIRDFLGRPLGGALFAVAAWLPPLLNALSYALCATLTSQMSVVREQSATSQGRSGLLREIAEGLRWLWGHRVLRTLAVAVSVDNLAFMAWNAVLVLLVEERLRLSGPGYGLMMALLGAGGVTGGLAMPRVARRFGSARPMIAAMACEGAAMVLLGLARGVVLAGGMLFLIGAAAIGWNVLSVALRQSIVPPHLNGRVSSAFRLIGIAGAPVGAVLGGFVARAFGLSAAFVLGGVTVVVAASVAALVIRRASSGPEVIHLDHLDSDPDRQVSSFGEGPA